MLYRMDSEYHNSQYIFIDWERLDACLKPSDRDKAGRLCGKRATSGKQAGKIKAGSEEAKALAQSIREQSYGTGRKGKSPQRKAAIADKAKETRIKKQYEKDRQERERNMTPAQKKARREASELRAKSIQREQAQIKQIANDPAAQKSLRRKIARNEGRAGYKGTPRQYILSQSEKYKTSGKTGVEEQAEIANQIMKERVMETIKNRKNRKPRRK